MTLTKDMFLSLLAMDAYNRGYNAGIGDGIGPKDANGNDANGLGEAGSIIGQASVIDISLPADAQAASFYAVAYRVEAGKLR